MDLKDKVVIITGGSKGLGLSLAKKFIRAGSKVIIASRDEAELKKVAEQIGAISQFVDVTDESSVQALADFVVKKFGRIDVWVNNAGIWLPHGPIEDMDLKRVHDMLEVNLFGTIYGSKYALLQMKKQKGGTIVNILSTSALTGRPFSSGYCASKYAATGFTKSLRLEVESDNIMVVAAYPGGMQTHFFDEQKPENYDEYMSPDEVAEKIVANLQSNQLELEQEIRRQK
ncbi:MAG: SDR family oxidoreductase [Candidatus Buchananbacteria bacterium]|nr:SDR family oxidoreductase [Candidatus Buchananbacteria bacterium]